MITLTTEQAQQIEEALDKLNSVYGLHETPCVAKALATIRAARAQEQAEHEPVAWVAEDVCDGQFINGKKRRIWWECIEGVGTPFYAAPQPDMNLNCKSVQKRLATSWGYVKAEQAEQEPLMDYERINALREGEQNGAEDAYFFVRPENDTPSLRKMFCQGFERGFHKGLKYASHVRTKDLTDEIDRLCAAIKAEDDYCVDNGNYMLDSNDCIKIIRGEWVRPDYSLDRAVIATYKEKNK